MGESHPPLIGLELFFSRFANGGFERVFHNGGRRVTSWSCCTIGEDGYELVAWENFGDDQHCWVNFLESFLIQRISSRLFVDPEIMESESFTSFCCAWKQTIKSRSLFVQPPSSQDPVILSDFQDFIRSSRGFRVSCQTFFPIFSLDLFFAETQWPVWARWFLA